MFVPRNTKLPHIHSKQSTQILDLLTAESNLHKQQRLRYHSIQQPSQGQRKFKTDVQPFKQFRFTRIQGHHKTIDTTLNIKAKQITINTIGSWDVQRGSDISIL